MTVTCEIKIGLDAWRLGNDEFDKVNLKHKYGSHAEGKRCIALMNQFREYLMDKLNEISHRSGKTFNVWIMDITNSGELIIKYLTTYDDIGLSTFLSMFNDHVLPILSSIKVDDRLVEFNGDLIEYQAALIRECRGVTY